jgi:hypothetical protein
VLLLPGLIRIRLPAQVFLLIVILLAFVQWKVDNPMLLLERFVPGGGWFEIGLIASYGALLASQMQDPRNYLYTLLGLPFIMPYRILCLWFPGALRG